MKTIEILKENKLAKAYIKEWFLNKLATGIKNFKGDENFKELMSKTTVTDEQINNIVSKAPRNLLDILDSQGVLISVVAKDKSFSGDVYNVRTETRYDVGDLDSRAEFDLHVLHFALPLLEENLAAAENQLVEEEQKKEDKS